ncbi:MAG TPA: outer membrane beta-barrel protein [Chitinophagaceae bacterium]|jgi:opacity protein-like surface antigen|nr:outer membrane beta-barrel protein [Chitinophagaceae bacterium]
MKAIYKYAGLSVIILMAFVSGQAQQKLQVQLGYNFNKPVSSSFKEVVSKTSFRGFNGEITYAINNQLNVGLGVSYNDFYQKYPRQMYNTTDGDLSAVVSNSIQTTPILAKVNYSFLKQGLVRPYVGLGAGFNFINYNQYLGEFPDSKTAFKPAVSGDAGVNVFLGKTGSTGLNLGTNFNYLPFGYNDVKNLNNWGVHAGVFFPLR